MLLFSCGETDQTADTNLYYPVEAVVTAQSDSLKKTSDTWVKTVLDDESTEEKRITANDVEWATELAMFTELNPNKKAYAGKFRTDTTLTEDGQNVTYTSDALKLQMLTVCLREDGSLKAIYGDLNTSNLFYASHYQLSLVPYKAFSINGTQTLKFFNTQKVFSVSWVRQLADSPALIR